MDPFTIYVSVLTVLAAVDRLAVLFPHGRQYFQARGEIEAFQTELQHLRMIMVAASESSAILPQAELEAVMDNCLGVLQALENDMAPFRATRPNTGTPNKPVGRRERLKWVARKSRISQTRQRLRDSVASMTLA